MDLKDLYAHQLLQLLPQGKAWTREKTSTLYQLLTGISEELARVDMRFNKSFDEADPRTTIELLPDWEHLTGLPSECSQLGENIQKRRENIIFSLTGIHGQSIFYLQTLLDKLRIKAKITEIRPFICGESTLGQDRLNGGAENRFYFIVEVLEERVTWLTCGLTELGQHPMALIDYAEELECYINRYKPAHTTAIIAYS